MQRFRWCLSSGWDIMVSSSSKKLAGGNVAFATIGALDEAPAGGDDGMQSVVWIRVRCKDWVVGLLRGRTRARAGLHRQDHAWSAFQYQRGCGSGVKR